MVSVITNLYIVVYFSVTNRVVVKLSLSASVMFPRRNCRFLFRFLVFGGVSFFLLILVFRKSDNNTIESSAWIKDSIHALRKNAERFTIGFWEVINNLLFEICSPNDSNVLVS